MEDNYKQMTDMFGNVLNIGDTICFNLALSGRSRDNLVRAKITGFNWGKTPKSNYIELEYLPHPDFPCQVNLIYYAEINHKLIKKVWRGRVIKCY